MFKVYSETNHFNFIGNDIFVIVSEFSDLLCKQLMPLSDAITSKLIMQIES